MQVEFIATLTNVENTARLAWLMKKIKYQPLCPCDKLFEACDEKTLMGHEPLACAEINDQHVQRMKYWISFRATHDNVHPNIARILGYTDMVTQMSADNLSLRELGESTTRRKECESRMRFMRELKRLWRTNFLLLTLASLALFVSPHPPLYRQAIILFLGQHLRYINLDIQGDCASLSRTKTDNRIPGRPFSTGRGLQQEPISEPLYRAAI